MNELNTTGIPVIIMMIGVLVGLALFIEAYLERIHVPALAGWIVLGVLTRMIGGRLGLLGEQADMTFDLLSRLGVITLLFGVGLRSNIAKLREKIGAATVFWILNVLLSGIAGYIAAYYLLDLGRIASLVIGIALTATSVGVVVQTWNEAGKLGTDEGQLLVDIVEMDDISSILLMGFLFAILPAIQNTAQYSVIQAIGPSALLFLARICGFGLLCLVLAKFLEKPIIRFVDRSEPAPDAMLTMVGLGFIIAALAGLIGFSLALGAFFAGLVFSRDPVTRRMQSSFNALYKLFTPFFFIGIGLQLEPGLLGSVVGSGAVLFAAAFLGKTAGVGIPALFRFGWMPSLLLGISLVPRAEITMIIMEHVRGRVLPDDLYAAMVVVAILTCVVSPVIVGGLLRRLPSS